MSPEFLLTPLVVVASPGTGAICTIAGRPVVMARLRRSFAALGARLALTGR